MATTSTPLPNRESGEFAGEVRTMFDRIAGVYDLMKTAMTAGMRRPLASEPPSSPSWARAARRWMSAAAPGTWRSS